MQISSFTSAFKNLAAAAVTAPPAAEPAPVTETATETPKPANQQRQGGNLDAYA